MARTIRWTRLVADDLEQAVEYIARDSPAYARAFARKVVDAGQSLAEFSERGAIVEELGDPSVRQLFIGSYRLVYLVAPEMVVLLGLIHARRNFGAAWKSEERMPPR
ncbi:MAG: type II toxin-antitoxin system RelE/ParE family toxin [Planctomycetaceae bacterium]|nr:type II toxin-antitoxin system RelE/ParE family toxin [Planctomycetaceae bacterium]